MNLEDRRGGLDARAVRGIRWTLLAYGGTRILGVAATLVLARLLVPHDFGLVAFAGLVIQLVVNFTSLGLGPAVVIRPGLDRRALGTIETAMLVLGPVSAAVVLALSPLAAELLGDHELIGVLAVMTIPVIFSGVTSFYSSLLQRELAFRSLSMCLLAQAAVTAVASTLLAALGAGVWSIVVGPVVGAGLYAGALLARSPFLVRPRFERDVVRQHGGHGIGFMLQAGFSFLEQNVDYAIVGAARGAQPLGAYSLAYRLSELPNNALVEPVAQVTLPGFARMQYRREEVAPSFLAVVRSVAVITCPIALILAAAAEPFVRTVLGEKWLMMVGPLSVLGIWGALRIVQATIAWMLNSLGVARALGRAYAAIVVVSIPLLCLAAIGSGLTAVSLVMLGDMIVMLVVAVHLAVRTLAIRGSRMFDALRPVVLAAAPTWLVTRVLAQSAGLPAAPALVASVTCGSLTYVLVLLLVDRGILRELWAQGGQVLSLRRPRTPTPTS